MEWVVIGTIVSVVPYLTVGFFAILLIVLLLVNYLYYIKKKFRS